MRRALPPLALAFCAGAALRLAVHVSEAAALPFALAIALALALAVARDRPTLGLGLSLALVGALGAWRTAAWLQDPSDSVSCLADRRWVRLHGAVIAEPERRPWGAWCDVAVDHAETRREPLRVLGRVRVYLPADVKLLPYGARVAAEGRVALPDDAGNPGEIPPAQYLRRDGIVATLAARAMWREPGRGGNSATAAALHARHALERGIAATLAERPAGLLRGLLFSDTAALPENARRDFARSGTVHILSTSGLHVALLAGLLSILFPARRPVARRARSLALLAALVLFALMTGLRPAVMRAVLMTGAALAAPIFNREADAWCALGLAALALVALSPGNLLDPGFQLSFAAAVALALWFARPEDRAKPTSRGIRWARASLAASTVASLATAPLAARYFGSCSLAAPLTNLITVPLVAPAMSLGLVQGALWPVAPWLARAAGVVNGAILNAMLDATAFIGRQPWSAIDVFPPGGFAVAAMLGALGAILSLRLMPAPRRAAVAPLLLPAGATFAAIWLGWRAWTPVPLRVTFLDVGQADAALIRTPRGRAVLVDAGGRYERRQDTPGSAPISGRDVGERVVVPALRRTGMRRVDVLVVTHPHEDHAGGLPALLEAMPVELWLDAGARHASPGYTDGLRLARARRTPIRQAVAGQRLVLEPGVILDVLAPNGPRLAGTRDDLNNNSLVVRLTFGRTAFLFCGDAEAEEEANLLRAGTDLRADVMKVGHHGGATSGGTDLLAAVRPAAVVISCGRHNPFGHPADAALARFALAGARVYRTDLDGAVVADSDGRRTRLRSSRWFIP